MVILSEKPEKWKIYKMVKINCCDICFYKENKTEQAVSKRALKTPTLKYEVTFCKGCKSKIPEDVEEFKKFALELMGV